MFACPSPLGDGAKRVTHCWLLVGCLILLAGCGPLPQPIQATPTTDVAVMMLTAPPLPLPGSTPPAAASTMPASPQPLAPGESTQYVVQAGDTLLGIALQHGVSMAAIQLVNDMGDSTVVKLGQTLLIPSALSENETPYWIVHVVQPGESLFKIAEAYDISVDDLLRVNAVADPALIVIGQLLVIPSGSLVIAQVPTATPTATPPPTSTPIPAATPTKPVSASQATLTPVPVSTSPTPTVQPSPFPLPTVPAEVSAWAGQVVDLINQQRLAHGLPVLSIAPELMNAAQAHANDCSERGWGGHTGSDGTSLLTRMQRAGYDAQAYGENWVQALDPAKAVAWWYNETPPNDPHRKNILNTRYSEIGVGIAPAGNGYYFIADFGGR